MFSMSTRSHPSVALLYPGDRAMRDRADPAESRFAALFDALSASGVRAVPAVYNDDFAEEVREQLSDVDGVLVWCNPIEGGRRRERLDALLRALSERGVFVSAHPDAVLRLGTKDVLFESRDLPFGSDVHRIDSLEQFDRELPGRLQRGARVLKQQRGHSGMGVWKVELVDPASSESEVRLRHAPRGAEEECVGWPSLRNTMAPYFEPPNGGHMIDQAWQPRLVAGMVRAYLVQDRVAGFGFQAVNALFPSKTGEPMVQPGPRLYFEPAEAKFQPLKHRLESGWVELLRERVGLARDRLPLLWDCDFMLREAATAEPTGYVLCEVNVSSVSPFPPSAITPLVHAVATRLRRGS